MSIFKKIYRKITRYKPYIIGKRSVIYPYVVVSNARGKKEDIVIGESTHIRADLILLLGHGGQISIGDYCFVGRNTNIWSGKSIQIGNRVLISHNCNIFDNDTHPKDPIERHEQYKEIISTGQPKEINLNDEEVIIEDDVWIGANVTILKGVKVGKGSIIGASSLVLTDIPEKSFYAGNPAKLIKKL